MSHIDGLFEELIHKDKQYPLENQRKYPIHPRDFGQALAINATREIVDTIQLLAANQQYDKMLEFVSTVRNTALQYTPSLLPVIAAPLEYKMPLQYVQYRFDDRPIPLQRDMYLTHPTFVTNHPSGPNCQNLFKVLKFELMTADSVDMVVSFVKWSGLQLLWRALEDLNRLGKPVRLLTTNYLSITEPKALRRLLEMSNVAVKMYDSVSESFHTKAYLFTRNSGLDTVIIGSSNLSHSALRVGLEWNVKLPNTAYLSIFSSAQQHFEEIWNHPQAETVTNELLDVYEAEYRHASTRQTQGGRGEPEKQTVQVVDVRSKYAPNSNTFAVEPNRMQKTALDALEQTRENGFSKGVIIAATGTGKTYLSAFDARAFGAQSVLFLAHRDELLEGAKDTFAEVFGNPDLCGKLTGNERDWDKPFLFSTVQMLYRDDVLTRFPTDHFDYVVVDEFHHAQASTYLKVLEYFKPKFLLGLTATPERLDGRDVLELCDSNVVYEIRLRQALSDGLLAPFHYFGLSDPTVDYEDVDQRGGQFVEADLVRALRTHERVDYVIEMMEKFGHDGDRRIALGFCANIDHARFMADEFCLRGYHATVLTGDDDPDYRRAMIQRLEEERDPLEIIFTVNVFNEGIDIPKVNLLLFLRPTESATIFLQQLGRGLRKAEGKEFVTILDFIGNYQKSFVVPLAISGQFNHRAFDRESLRIAVETEFADLPDGCFVDLEPVSREQILQKIDGVRMNQGQLLAEMYKDFKARLGRSPEIEDFLYVDGAPNLHLFIQKYHSWVETKKRNKDLNDFDERLLSATTEFALVRRLENMLPLKWPYEFAVLQEATRMGSASIFQVLSNLQRRFGSGIGGTVHEEYIHRAMHRLAQPHEKDSIILGQYDQNQFAMNPEVLQPWNAPWVQPYLNERLYYGLSEFRHLCHPSQFFESEQGLVLHQNYKRKDVLFLFQVDKDFMIWERDGVCKKGDHYVLYVTLEKGEEVPEQQMYLDYFMDNQHLHWQSQSKTTSYSVKGQDYIHHKARGLHIHLFVRKRKEMQGISMPFVYMGEADYVDSHGDSPMNITWRLHHRAPDDLLMDFVRPTDR